MRVVYRRTDKEDLYQAVAHADIDLLSQQTHNVLTTTLQRRCNVVTLQRRRNDVVATLCVCLLFRWTAKTLIKQHKSAGELAFAVCICDKDNFLTRNCRKEAKVPCRSIRSCKFNQFMPSGLLYRNSLDRVISNRRDVWLILLLLCFIEMPVLNANSVKSDHTSQSAASDLDLYCQYSFFGIRHKCVNVCLEFQDGCDTSSHQAYYMCEVSWKYSIGLKEFSPDTSVMETRNYHVY